jgi:hypothetical protein
LYLAERKWGKDDAYALTELNPPQAAADSSQAIRRVSRRLSPLLVEKLFQLCYTKQKQEHV